MTTLEMVTYPPLCTLDDVRALGVPITDEGAALRLIEAASAAVRATCGWVISYVEGDQLIGRGVGGLVVDLDTLRLVDVTEVRVSGEVLAAIPAWRPEGVLYLRVNQSCQVVAVCNHGYDPVPADVAMTTAGMVGKSLASPVGVVGERVGAWSVNYDASPFAPNASRSSVRVTPSELDTLAPYTLPRVP